MNYQHTLLLVLYLGLAGTLHAQFMPPDTLLCGDTLAASFDPFQGGLPTDSFYVWIGNCQTNVRFDFTTANVPDGAEIFYVDMDGNLTSAGSIPYFGETVPGRTTLPSQPSRYFLPWTLNIVCRALSKFMAVAFPTKTQLFSGLCSRRILNCLATHLKAPGCISTSQVEW